MKPSVGRIVHYKLSQGDVDQISTQLSHAKRNPVAVGEVYPAMVVRTWNDGAGCNLQVSLDGDCSYWATSRVEGDGEGQWSWPPRV